jgi:hypothetical protein
LKGIFQWAWVPTGLVFEEKIGLILQVDNVVDTSKKAVEAFG